MEKRFESCDGPNCEGIKEQHEPRKEWIIISNARFVSKMVSADPKERALKEFKPTRNHHFCSDQCLINYIHKK